jgi:hypothetical protein
MTSKLSHTDGRLRTWVVTPHYGALGKKEKPVNAYTDVHYSTDQDRTTAYKQNLTSGAITYDFLNAYVSSGQTMIQDMQARNGAYTSWGADRAPIVNAVKLKALTKVADAKVNVAVALAEARKTSDLILDTANRVYKAYRAFRRGDLKGIATNLNITPKRLHKSWLEYKYGWLPLLMDVKGAAEFFAQQHIVRSPEFTVSAVEQVAKTYSHVDMVPTYGGGATHPIFENYSNSRIVKVKLWCRLDFPHVSELQQIGLTNPALVAWELIPFSFVFDWFVSVGDWLTGLTALNGVNVYRGMMSDIEVVEETLIQVATSRTVSGVLWSHSGSSVVAEQRAYNRVSFIPDPLSVYPPVINSFDFKKLVTSLALIQGNFKRGNGRL